MRKVICFVVIAAVFCTLSCVSPGRGIDGNVLAYQAEIDRLEGTVRQYDSAMRAAAVQLRDITVRARGMEGTVDDIIGLFDEYQRAVDGLIRDYNTLRRTLEEQDKTGYVASRPAYYQDYRNDYRVYPVRQRNQAAQVGGYTTLKEAEYEQEDF